VDKVLVFIAPIIAGAGAAAVAGLDTPATLRRLTARSVGQDLLLSGYVHEP
jgi:riboflavin biosynthesis pyrimidine reductase